MYVTNKKLVDIFLTKIERLISIVMMLLARETISAQELADYFQVTKRTILRDMDTLNLANIPIYAIRGSKGSFGIMPTYKFDKRLLSVTDLQNVLVALGGFQNLMLNEDIKTTLTKIRGMIPSEVTQNSVSISFHQWAGRNELASTMEMLQKAIKTHHLVQLTYIDVTGQQTTRQVEPYQLQARETRWYLEAYSLNRQAYRSFKISRITASKLLTTTFKPRDYQAQVRHQPGTFPFPSIPVRVRIDASIRDQFVERYGAKVLNVVDSNHYDAEITVPYHEFGYRYLAGFGSRLQVIAPKDFVENYKRFLKQLLSQYDK